jgi:hypothetical protein
MSVVNKVFNLDINLRSRVKIYTEARMVFCIILKEEGFGSSRLGRILNITHGSIHNYWLKAESYIATDRTLRERYFSVRKEFYEDQDPIYSGIKNELEAVNMENKVLSLRNAQLEASIKKSLDEELLYGSMFTIIKERTPSNKEAEVEQKLKRFFNGLFV